MTDVTRPNLDHLRSPHWPAVRKLHLEREPVCVACGGTEHLQVHHLLPFHLHPTLELEATNLVTLCEAPGRECHHVWGHLLDWKSCNPHVRKDAQEYREKVRNRPTLVDTPHG